jgi:DNA repair exonuclease SbcCD ATPase subunit
MNREEYDAGIEFLELKDPHYALLPQLKKSFNAINVLYLRRAIEKYDIRDEVESEEASDPVMRKMYIEQSKLFGKRAKISNQFHKCKTDKTRARISDQVQEIQREIEAVRKRIRHYRKTGRVLEDDIKKEKYPIPDNAYDCFKKRNSIRAMISRYKSKLKELGRLPDHHPDRKQIPEYEAKLKDKEIYLTHVQKEIDTKYKP